VTDTLKVVVIRKGYVQSKDGPQDWKFVTHKGIPPVERSHGPPLFALTPAELMSYEAPATQSKNR
jgi:hypothetical protein